MRTLRIALLVVGILCCAAMFGCGGGSGTPLTSGSPVTASLSSIDIVASPTSVAAGLTSRVTAMGKYSDGSTKDMTTTVTWSSSDATLAAVDSTGLVTAKKAGTVQLTGTSGGVSKSIPFTVTAAALKSIAITPVAASVAKGLTHQFTATGTYTDNTTQNLSSTVTWTSASTNIASIAADGLATAVSPGTTTITATSGAFSDHTTLTVTGAVLQSITVLPGTASIAAGLTQTFIAFGNFSDLSSTDVSATAQWSTSDAAKGTLTGAVVKGVSAGDVTITATMGAIHGAAVLTVTPASLQSIDVSPDLPTIDMGGTVALVATGTFSDNSDGEIAASWSSSNPAVAIVNTETGLVTGVSEGTTDITADAGNGITDVTTVTVNPATLALIAVAPDAPTMAAGTSQTFTATGTFTDGSTQPMTGAVWSSATPTVLTIDAATGVAKAVAPGTAIVTATQGTISGSTTVTVTNATLRSIAITPANPVIGAGGNLQFTATGTFTDDSSQVLGAGVIWTSSDGTKVIVDATGIATALATGSSTITAAYSGVTGSTLMTVSAATLQSIDVQPNNPVVVRRTRLQMKAVGVFSDASTKTLVGVSWSSNRNSVANVNGSGVLRSKKSGSATIRASLGGRTGTELVRVTSSAVVSIEVTPDTAVASVGTRKQFIATGEFGDGSTTDLSMAASWTTSDFTVATVNSNGLVTTLKPGTVTIKATYGGLSNTATLTVN